MDNADIARLFSTLAKLIEIHGGDPFRAKNYSSLAFTIEKLPVELASMPFDQMAAVRGIGKSTASKIRELMETRSLAALDELASKTPAGIFDLMKIKGLGPKKIATLWKDLGIEDPAELLYACGENRLCALKGFGEKTQESIRESLEFFLANQGSFLWAQVESFALDMTARLLAAFPDSRFELTGAFRRQMEVIDQLEWVTDCSDVTCFFEAGGYIEEALNCFRGPEKLLLCFHYAPASDFGSALFRTSAIEEFLRTWGEIPDAASEEALFAAARVQAVPPFRREQPVASAPTSAPIGLADVRALIHSHSKWSDGAATIETMARACMDRGMEYMVISDHSRSAGYAGGLSIERVAAQQQEIDELNGKLNPFRIFKSIECDILNDGSLDYPDQVLSTFDLVICSVHSNLDMTTAASTARILRTIENPYCTILGHMTGRLLLSRRGNPVDHEAIIDACAANGVVIELNANPRRLDMDWRWIDRALDRGVLISINPDAHSVADIDKIRFGVLVAQKTGLTPEKNLSSFGLEAFEKFLKNRSHPPAA